MEGFCSVAMAIISPLPRTSFTIALPKPEEELVTVSKWMERDLHAKRTRGMDCVMIVPLVLIIDCSC